VTSRPARVLMVSPHFPPDTSAGAHRVRLLAPHLLRYGWEPTVLTVDPGGYEGRLDEGLAAMVPPTLRVVRSRAWSPARIRRLGVGDLGLRALPGLYRTARDLLRHERWEALFVTTFPVYPALLGPLLKRRLRTPFVLDYQDPWIGAWGKTVGGGPGGRPDLKSRLSRLAALVLEARVIRAADAITAVSRGTYEAILGRYSFLRGLPCEEIPLGGEPRDFEWLRRAPRSNPYFDPADGSVHVCYVGTLLPLGFETLRAVLGAARLLRERRPDLYARLRLRFFGTSNQTTPDAPQRVLPVARDLLVTDCVSEIAPRIDYLDALTVQTQATAILMMGSSEPHYTASKLYPGLLARRPLLAVYHRASTVVDVLRAATRSPTVRLVTYDDAQGAETRVESVYTALRDLTERPSYEPADVDLAVVHRFSAEVLAGRLATVLDRVAGGAGAAPERAVTAQVAGP
jgi:glycosyltransferase involved in cell wall biosynthesis